MIRASAAHDSLRRRKNLTAASHRTSAGHSERDSTRIRAMFREQRHRARDPEVHAGRIAPAEAPLSRAQKAAFEAHVLRTARRAAGEDNGFHTDIDV